MKSAAAGAYGLSANRIGRLAVVAIVAGYVLYLCPVHAADYPISVRHQKSAAAACHREKDRDHYGIVAFVAAVFIGYPAGDSSPGGAVFLWSFLNYLILKGGRPASFRRPKNPGIRSRGQFLRRKGPRVLRHGRTAVVTKMRRAAFAGKRIL
jgi:hypothetical protein